MSIGVLWEFIEFGADRLLGMDMQKDYVVTNIVSDLLGNNTGDAEIIEDISSVVVNGRKLELNGYLDIGLYDTMYDMLVCALGAGIFCILILFKDGAWAAPFLPQVLRTE